MRDQYKTGEGSPDDDDSYLGYSVTTGEFDGDGDNADVAVGMPRGAGLNGKVLVYNRNLTNTYNLTGDQVRNPCHNAITSSSPSCNCYTVMHLGRIPEFWIKLNLSQF